MKTKRTFFDRPFIRFSLYAFLHLRTLLLFILICAFLASCVEQRMSLKEAKRVTVSMEGKSLVPPPRRIDNVIEILNQPDRRDPKLSEKMKKICESSPPKNAGDEALSNFYLTRCRAAIYLGRFKQVLEDSRTALHHADKAGLNNKSQRPRHR